MAELERLDEHRARIEDWLHACFQDCAPRGNLYDAMRYSLLAGGKRLRPVLVLEACPPVRRSSGGCPALCRGD